ncbi:hypothetical protein KFL_001160280 [Klebsormidium nitens]|uniref:Uncharacterized protein n=1 Tax=Klebsormidium nitens TaxID=105231 RepID=A0A1Y1HVE0_KLENI|nr:hypothetical protein KFL_001160280 [Klebsormidium nitens]|eukprot:GAQ82594.1 hypothetical protein KFL_001160280 [Klebsormidium nitens]
MAASGNSKGDEQTEPEVRSDSRAEAQNAKGPPSPEEQVDLKDTVVPFTSPRQPPREPATITTQGKDPHVLGPQVLAFADQASWEEGLGACERVATGQCEKGARMGCSVTAARKCQPNWFQRLPMFKKKSTPETVAAQEQCESREFEACFSKASQKCAEHSRTLCGDVYGGARIAGKDDVMLITAWEDDDESNEIRQLQTGEKVISSSKGAPWMPPALGESIETQVPDEKDAERRRSGRKARSASRGGVESAAKEGGRTNDSQSGGLWNSEEASEGGGVGRPRDASKAALEKDLKQVTGTDGVAYRVVRIGGRTGPDGKPLKALQSLKDGSVKFMDADGQVKKLAGREKKTGKREQAGGEKGGVVANRGLKSR